MRPISLHINGLPADLPGTKGLVRLTQARAALAELSARIGEYSWPLSLPPTRNNARIFGVGALHPLGLDKFRGVDFAYELRCDGEIFTGNFRLTSLRGGYTGQLLGAGFSWAALLGEKTLTELQLPAVPYNGSQLEAIQLLTCEETDIQFPLVSFGNFYHPPQLSSALTGEEPEEQSLPAQALLAYPLAVDDYPPAVYLRNVLRQIFADIGWTLTGRVLDSPEWRETLLTCAGADVSAAWPWGALLPARATGTATTAGHSQFMYYNGGPGNGFTTSALGFDEASVLGNVSGLDLGGEVGFLAVPVPVIESGGTRALDGPTATFTAPIPGTYTFAYRAKLESGNTTLALSNSGPPNAAQLARFRPILLCALVRRGGQRYDSAPLSLNPLDESAVLASHRVDTTGGTGVDLASTFIAVGLEVYLETGDTVQLVTMARRRLIDLPTGRVLADRTGLVLNWGAVSFECTAYDGEELLSPAKFLPPLKQRELVREFLLKTDTVPVADHNRRTVSLLTRDEQSTAAGKVIDLSDFIDPDLLEYTPAAGAGVGAVVFAAALNGEEPLPVALDVVRVSTGPGEGEQRIESLFAPVAFRSYALPQPTNTGQRAELPTFSTREILAQPLAEVSPDPAAQAPRLLRYLGPDPLVTVPFQERRVPLARSSWSGALRWAGAAGAVATYYRATVEQLTRGHLAKGPVSITPALYRSLTPGRRVEIVGARYRVESVAQFDLADEKATTNIDLIREL